MTLGEKIVQLRKQNRWGQQDLCTKIGIKPTHLSRIENGKSQPSADLLYKIAKAFGVTMDFLFNEDAEEPTPVTIKDKTLASKLELIEQLNSDEKQTIINVIDSMLTKKKMVDLLLKVKTAENL